MRGNISKFIISNSSDTSHIITNSVNGCNGLGEHINLTDEFYMENSDNKNYYIDHFYSKSLEEFIDKIKRGSAVHGDNLRFKLFRIIRYFNINKLKYFKYKLLKEKLGLKIN